MVSTPLRTALDIALHVEPVRAIPAFQELLDRPELNVRLRLLVLAIEATPRVPHKKAALEKLSQLTGRSGQARAGLVAAPVARGPVNVEDAVDATHGTQHVAEVLGVTHFEGELGNGHPVS